MPVNTAPDWLCLKPAIDPRPLTVDLDTPLTEAIAIMGKARSSCVLSSVGVSPQTLLVGEARASCILVTHSAKLIGILTEQNVVDLIASGKNLDSMIMAQAMHKPVCCLTLAEAPNIFTALSSLHQHQVSHLPVLDDADCLIGMVTWASLRQTLQLDELLKSSSVSQVAIAPVIEAPSCTSALGLAQLMAEHQVDCVVLTNNSTVGIVTARDIVQLQALQLDLSQIPGESIVRPPLLDLKAVDSALAALWKMQQAHWQWGVIVSDRNELEGVITPTSFLQTLDIAEMYRAVEQLQQSIQDFEVEKAQLQYSDRPQVKQYPAESSAELLEQLERNRILTSIALRIRESLNLDEILQTAVNEVQQILQTDRAIVYKFNPDMSGTVMVESRAEAWQSVLGRTITDNCFGKNYAQAYKEGRILVTEDIYAAGLTQCHIDILALFDIRANVVVPILQGEHLWGLLCAYHCSGPRFWREFEVDLLKHLSTQIAIALQQSELYEKAQAELAERKRAEDKLKASLKEKEVLLKEIHHRVKNNLQIISSLLKLQSSYIKDEQTLALFKDSQNRIRSMALIHEKLYQSQDLSRINFAEYIQELTAQLLRSYGASSQSVTLKTNVRDILLDIDTAIPCSLIINELVSNSLKHAFPVKQEANAISIDVYPNSLGSYTLSVKDNGIGLPEDFDFNNNDSLGLELVCTLTEQLEGTIEFNSDNGTSFEITFLEIGKPSRI